MKKLTRRGKQLINSQEYFCEEADEKAKIPMHTGDERVFVPAEAPEEE